MTSRYAALGLAFFPLTAVSAGSIDLSLLPDQAAYPVGAQVAVQVRARAASGEPEGMLSFQMIFTWDPSRLQLLGVSTAGAPSFTGIGFFHDAYGINESSPPTDGTAMLIGLGPLGSSIMAPTTPNGALLTTMLFTALAPSQATPLTILPSAGNPVGISVVYGDTGPNVNNTGVLTGTSVTIIPAPSAAGLLAVGFVLKRRRREAPAVRARP